MDETFRRRVAAGARNLMFEGYERGAAEMRERAAKLVEDMEPDGFNPFRFQDQIAQRIRALPIDTAHEGE